MGNYEKEYISLFKLLYAVYSNVMIDFVIFFMWQPFFLSYLILFMRILLM